MKVNLEDVDKEKKNVIFLRCSKEHKIIQMMNKK